MALPSNVQAANNAEVAKDNATNSTIQTANNTLTKSLENDWLNNKIDGAVDSEENSEGNSSNNNGTDSAKKPSANAQPSSDVKDMGEKKSVSEVISKYLVEGFRAEEIELRKRMTVELNACRNGFPETGEKYKPSEILATLSDYLDSLRKLDSAIKSNAKGNTVLELADPRLIKIQAILNAKIGNDQLSKKKLNPKKESEVRKLFDDVMAIHEQMFEFEFDEELYYVFHDKWNVKSGATFDQKAFCEEAMRLRAILQNKSHELYKTHEKLVRNFKVAGGYEVQQLKNLPEQLALRHKEVLEHLIKIKDPSDMPKVALRILIICEAEMEAKEKLNKLQLLNAKMKFPSEETKAAIIKVAQDAAKDARLLADATKELANQLAKGPLGKDSDQAKKAAAYATTANLAAEVAQKNADEAEVNYMLALDAYEKGSYSQALKIVNDIIETNGNKKRDEAEKAYNSTIELAFSVIQDNVPKIKDMLDEIKTGIADKPESHAAVKLVVSKLGDNQDNSNVDKKISKDAQGLIEQSIKHADDYLEAVGLTTTEIVGIKSIHENNANARIAGLIALMKENSIPEHLDSTLTLHSNLSSIVDGLKDQKLLPAKSANVGNKEELDAGKDLKDKADLQNAKSVTKQESLKKESSKKESAKKEISKLNPANHANVANAVSSLYAGKNGQLKQESSKKESSNKEISTLNSAKNANVANAALSSIYAPGNNGQLKMKKGPMLMSSGANAANAASNEAKLETEKLLKPAGMEAIKAEQKRLRQEAAKKNKAGKK